MIKNIFCRFFKKEINNTRWIADVSVAGLQHYRGNDLADLIKEGDLLNLSQQPENKFDENAIIVSWQHNKLGYIPKSLVKEINRQINSGVVIKATVSEIKAIRFGRKWLKIRLESEKQTEQ